MQPDLQAVFGAFAAVVATLLTAYLMRSARPTAQRDGEMMLVEYGGRLKILVLGLWLGTLGLANAAVFAVPSERLLAIGVVAVSFLITLSLHLEFFRVRIRYHAHGLHLESPWRRNRFIPWEAITKVGFSPTLLWYVLDTTGSGKVRLHVYLSGLKSLLDELSSRGLQVPATAP